MTYPTITGYTTPYYDYASAAQKGYVGFVGRQPIYGQPNVGNMGQVHMPAPVEEAVPAYVAPTVNQTVNTPPPASTVQMNQYGIPQAGQQVNMGGTNMTSLGNGAYTDPSGGILSRGINAQGQTTYGGATAYGWAGLGLNTAFGLFNAYQGYKAQKLAQQQFEDQKRLNHANYQMQAKAFNNNLRNQQSGRSYIGMTASAKRTLGDEYKRRKAADDY